MGISQIQIKLKLLIDDYLNSVISRNEMLKELFNIQSPAEIADINDELIKESYFAIYHMNEMFCEVTNVELKYYRDCLEGKRLFSRYERDNILQK